MRGRANRASEARALEGQKRRGGFTREAVAMYNHTRANITSDLKLNRRGVGAQVGEHTGRGAAAGKGECMNQDKN